MPRQASSPWQKSPRRRSGFTRPRMLVLGLVCFVFPPWTGGTQAAPSSTAKPPGKLLPIAYSQLIATSGEIRDQNGDEFALLSPTVRAVVGSEPRQAIEMTFLYRGPTRRQAALASGELRRQLGLKLRARDTCNVVYVMWHIEPTRGLHVSVKSNPGQSEHQQCADHGYRNLTPEFASQNVPDIHVGERHTLAAAIDGDRLRVDADGVLAWVGRLPPEALRFDGPIGLRSDNGDFVVRLRGTAPAELTISPRPAKP